MRDPNAFAHITNYNVLIIEITIDRKRFFGLTTTGFELPTSDLRRNNPTNRVEV